MGFMRLFELYHNNVHRKEFDLKDDLMYFMNNDPDFYRQEMHPFVHKFKKHSLAGRHVLPKAFAPLVKRGFDHYKNTFQVHGIEDQLDDNDLEEICEQLHGQEMKNFHDENTKASESK